MWEFDGFCGRFKDLCEQFMGLFRVFICLAV